MFDFTFVSYFWSSDQKKNLGALKSLCLLLKMFLICFQILLINNYICCILFDLKVFQIPVWKAFGRVVEHGKQSLNSFHNQTVRKRFRPKLTRVRAARLCSGLHCHLTARTPGFKSSLVLSVWSLLVFLAHVWVFSWVSIQGLPHLHPTIAGIGSSIPVTPGGRGGGRDGRNCRAKMTLRLRNSWNIPKTSG